MKLLILVLCLIIVIIADEPPLLCSGTFCKKYLQDNKCFSVPEECQIQNATHNGLEVPSPVPCNCCNACLANIPEGGYCAVGAVGDPVPDSICGPGLFCDSDKTCKPMHEITDTTLGTSKCSQEQQAYDLKKQDGTLGHMEVRPICDDGGDFAPYKCVPGQTCHCVDKSGNRIYGEMLDDTLVPKLMHCQCSRRYADAVFVIGKELNPFQHFRCTPDGDYDTLQCIGDECLCVDAQDGVPTYPQTPSVNITLIHNKTLIKCFDDDYHEKVGYYRPCALIYQEALEEVTRYEEDGFSWVLNYDYPKCDLDQNFAPVQVSADENYCADPQGVKIENFAIPLNDPGQDEMDCKCARTRFLIGSSKIEKPECCPNGNFRKIQCRRGLCRCVDRDGHQIEQEVGEDRLDQLKNCNVQTSCDFP